MDENICIKCNSRRVGYVILRDSIIYKCFDCGYRWEEHDVKRASQDSYRTKLKMQ